MVGIVNGISIGSRRGAQISGGASGPTYDADASTLFTAMVVQPDATRKVLINTFILALKAAGVWALLDRLWVMAAHTEQAGLLDWKGVGNLTAVNAPTFVADQGHAGNGTTSYLNTGYIPSTHGVNFALTNASFGVYSRSNSDANVIDIGARSSSNQRTYIVARNGGSMYSLANQSGDTTQAVVDSLGLIVARRTASNSVGGVKNGVVITPSPTASAQAAAVAMYIGARNNSGAADFFTTRQYPVAFVGASLSAQQQLDLFTAIEAYLDSIGAGVV